MNQTTITKQRGLSDFALKYFAMVCADSRPHSLFFSHLQGRSRCSFSWIGRLAAPLFSLLYRGGFSSHARPEKKYFLRIYAIAVFMGLVQFSFYNIASGLVRPDGFFPQNQMLASFSVLLVVLWGIDRCQKKQWIRGLSAIRFRSFCPFFCTGCSPYRKPLAFLRQFSLKPSGVQCPALPHCDHRRWHRHTARRRDSLPDAQTPPIAGRCLCTFRACVGHPARAAFMPAGTSASFFFTDAYEWLEVFAIIPMLCYNGTRGHGSKKLFYWFYPTHTFTCCTHFRSFLRPFMEWVLDRNEVFMAHILAIDDDPASSR